MLRLDVLVPPGLVAAIAALLAPLGTAAAQEPASSTEGIYCRLRGEEYDERVAGLKELLASARDTTETKTGVRFVFDDAPGVAHDLLDLAERERDCCPFLRFTFEWIENGGPLVLTVSGPPEAKAVILAAFGEDLAR